MPTSCQAVEQAEQSVSGVIRLPQGTDMALFAEIADAAEATALRYCEDAITVPDHEERTAAATAVGVLATCNASGTTGDWTSPLTCDRCTRDIKEFAA